MLKYVSINIEGHRHLEERILPFLEKEQADVVSLQEVFEVDVPLLELRLGMKAQFTPMAVIREVSIHSSHALGTWGLVQLSKVPIIASGFAYYQGHLNFIPDFDPGIDPNSMNRALRWLIVEQEGQMYTFVTTHFIWTPNGDPSPLQHEKLAIMWQILASLPPYVISGDFNAPRGQAIFGEMASRLKDNIPTEVTTSIDGSLHKAGNIQLMVDGLFSTPEYRLSNVRVVDGVSDHKALVVDVAKV